MSIIVRDETAGVVILTIDNDGNICFGDGTPINRLTLDGYGLIDDNGRIVHGGTSSSVSCVSGNADVGFNQTATITTLAGRTPTVQLDTDIAVAYSTGEAGQLLSDPIPGVTIHALSNLTVGQFSIKNQNTATEEVQINTNFDATINNAGVAYRWL